MHKIFGLFATLMTVLFLVGCGEEAFIANDNSTSADNNTGIGGDTQTDTGISIGSGTGTSFSAGTLGIANGSISAGGSTSITVTLQSGSGALYTESATIVFTSSCTALGTATLDSNVTTTTGIAFSSYVAQGCSGTDTITATTTVDGTTLTASGTVTVAPAALGSIQFISATPSLISLQGTGGSNLSESGTVVFKVIDETGGPVAGQDVNFALNTTVGGLSLTPATATTATDGTVQTTVQSGTVATAVRVTASITTPAISTQSDQLVVSTGIPDQDSFSLSASVLNPEGLNWDGETVQINAYLADRFNNPVPDGTAITFSTEGGSIESFCTTTGGNCSVTWTSQNPRPCGQRSSSSIVVLNPNSGPNVCENSAGTNSSAPNNTSFGQPYGGRATIIATAIGEESFIDVNGDGFFSDGDFYTDLDEAYRDENESSTRDFYEQFVDFNENGTYDMGDNLFNGVLCTHSTLCSTTKSLNVRQNLVLVMAGSAPYIGFTSAPPSVANGGSTSVSYAVSDVHNQPLPAGTSISVTCTIGSVPFGAAGTVLSTNYNGPLNYSFTWKGGKVTGGESGSCIIEVNTPKGGPRTASITVTELP